VCGLYCLIVDEVSEDRMIALRKRAELEAKYVVILNPNDDSEFQLSLNRYWIFYWKLFVCVRGFIEFMNEILFFIFCAGWRISFRNYRVSIIEKKEGGLNRG